MRGLGERAPDLSWFGWASVDICPNRPTPAGLVPPQSPNSSRAVTLPKIVFPTTLKCSGVLAVSILGVLAVSIRGDM